MIRLVAFDLDGTLIGPDLTLRPAVRDAVRRMRVHGIEGCIVTGRMCRAALPFARALGFTAPLVCYQGAGLFAADGCRLLSAIPLRAEIVAALIAYASEHSVHLQLYRDDAFYCERRNRFSDLYAGLAGVAPVIVPSLAQAFDGATSLKAVVIADPPEAEQHERRLRALLGARAYVTRSNPEFVEILAPDANKGAGLREAARLMGIPMDAVAAIGDSWNDIPLLEVAALKIAMGSAPPELRRIADATVGSVGEDGVAEAIDRYILPAVPAG